MDRKMWKITLLPTIEAGRIQAYYVTTGKCNWIGITWLFWTIIFEFGIGKGDEV